MRGVSVIPRADSLRVSLSQSTGILGIPLPALLSNIGGVAYNGRRFCVSTRSMNEARLGHLPIWGPSYAFFFLIKRPSG